MVLDSSSNDGLQELIGVSGSQSFGKYKTVRGAGQVGTPTSEVSGPASCSITPVWVRENLSLYLLYVFEEALDACHRVYPRRQFSPALQQARQAQYGTRHAPSTPPQQRPNSPQDKRFFARLARQTVYIRLQGPETGVFVSCLSCLS